MKSNPSRMDDTSAHVLEYRSYWLSMSVILTLKDILGMSIFVYSVSYERKNGSLKVMGVSIFSHFENIES